jgi:ribose transport system substrate-binding protein
MKKIFLYIISVALIATMGVMTGCAQTPAEPGESEEPETSEPAVSDEKEILAVSLPALDNPLMLGFSEAFTAAFGEEYDVQVVSADGNPNTQATQIENLTTQNAKFLFVMPAEATSLVPKLAAARETGMIVLTAGGNPGDPDAYDSAMFMNQYLAGVYAAYMAKEWVDETYPDAEDASVETVIFQSSLNEEAVARSRGLNMISEPYLKNVDGDYVDNDGNVVSEAERVDSPIYSSKVKVVATVEAEMFQAGQTAMQNVLTTNPNVKLVIAYAGDGGMGASQAIIDEYNKGAGISVIDDLDKVAVIGVGMIGAEGPAVLDSAANKTVFRGTIRFGGDLIGRTIEIAGKMLNGEMTKVIYDPLDIVKIIDGKLMSIAIESTEHFTIPTAEPQEVILMGPPG